MVAIVAAILFASVSDPQVYFGKLEGAKKSGEVISRSVFTEIPEYQKIKEKGLTSEDPEYWILLSKANDKFYAAVRKVGDVSQVDVIVEKGTAPLNGSTEDLTQKVIAALLP
jgi:hypothetical protein